MSAEPARPAVRLRPILFSAPMVRAILAGTKTQTRRIIKGEFRRYEEGWSLEGREPRTLREDWCPHGQAGDRVWIRETWRSDDFAPDDTDRTIYRADAPDDVLRETRGIIRWRPGRFMPLVRSRITLELTDVRVQRLQEITEEDAIAEGVTPYEGIGPDQRVPGPGFGGVLLSEQPHRLPFADLWDQVQLSRSYYDIGRTASWAANPWVWALTFRRIA